jgi:hypothetical protein
LIHSCIQLGLLIGLKTTPHSLKLKQDKHNKKLKADKGPSTRNEWWYKVKTLLHDFLFPKDAQDTKRVPQTKMGSFLFSNEQRLLHWPSKLNLPTTTFNLNKLNEPDLKLLCKSAINLEDWTEGIYSLKLLHIQVLTICAQQRRNPGVSQIKETLY